MPNENGVYYEGPITIYFAKSLMLPDDTGEFVQKQSLTIGKGKVFRNEDPKILSVINELGTLFHFNFNEIVFFALHEWDNTET